MMDTRINTWVEIHQTWAKGDKKTVKGTIKHSEYKGTKGNEIAKNQNSIINKNKRIMNKQRRKELKEAIKGINTAQWVIDAVRDCEQESYRKYARINPRK